jgi:hypothetical protein
MARSYERTVRWRDRGDIDVPDWELLARVGELLAPYLAMGGVPEFEGHDERGSYRSLDLDEFRKDVEGQDEPPNWIRVSYHAPTQDERLVHYQLELVKPGYIHGSTFALANGTDEGLMMLLVERSEALLQQAASRRKSRRQRAARQALAMTPADDRQSWWTRYGIQIVIGIIVAVVGGLIVAALLHVF